MNHPAKSVTSFYENWEDRGKKNIFYLKMCNSLPLLRGMKLGAFTAINAASLDCLHNIEIKKQDLSEAYFASLFNLLIIGPWMYVHIQRWTKNNLKNLRIFQTFSMITIHSALYSFFHKCMHKCPPLRRIHKFHHTFSTNVTPIVANAVSTAEFLFAYMLPFAIGSCIVRPEVSSLDASILCVSFFNLLVHSPNLQNIPWPTIMVAPQKHLLHHKTRSSDYSAPTLDWGELKEIMLKTGKQIKHSTLQIIKHIGKFCQNVLQFI